MYPEGGSAELAVTTYKTLLFHKLPFFFKWGWIGLKHAEQIASAVATKQLCHPLFAEQSNILKCPV
jgi:hypothetical protein